MNRRDLIAMLGGAAVAWPVSAHAEPMRTLGVLMPYSESDPLATILMGALRRSLAELDWHEGVNFRLEVRWVGDDDAFVRTQAKELVALKPDVLLAPATTFAPLREATRSIPIVFV